MVYLCLEKHYLLSNGDEKSQVQNLFYVRLSKEKYDSSKRNTDDVFFSSSATYRSLLHTAVFKDNSPFSLHLAMFIPAIMGQADEEQRKYWMKRASKMEIIGTYAQVCFFLHYTLLR